MHRERCPICGEVTLVVEGRRRHEQFPELGVHHCSAEALRAWAGDLRECICGAPVIVRQGRKLNHDGTPHACAPRAEVPRASARPVKGRGGVPV